MFVHLDQASLLLSSGKGKIPMLHDWITNVVGGVVKLGFVSVWNAESCLVHCKQRPVTKFLWSEFGWSKFWLFLIIGDKHDKTGIDEMSAKLHSRLPK